MILSVVDITKHGKYSKIQDLKNEILKCPECGAVDTFPFTDSFYSMDSEFTKTHKFDCKTCGCEFEVQLEDK